MFELHCLEKNDRGLEASVWCFADRTARLSLNSTCLDLSHADAAVESFREDLQGLRLKEFNVETSPGENKLTVVCRFQLPRVWRKRRINSILSAVLQSYERHFVPLMVEREDAFFGRLLWDGGLRRWTTDVTIDGGKIPLSVQDWGRRDLSETIRDARELVENWDRWKPRIREALVRDLLDLYNDEWRRDGTPAITATELHDRLTIYSIDCDDDGWQCVNYDADEMFTDHDIEMRISPEGEVTAVISG